MAAGISAALALGAIALLFLTFRSGVALYQKILGYVTLAGLAYFYYPELVLSYKQIAAGDYKTALKEFVTVLQVSLPVVAFALFWMAFIVSSAMDAGKLLLFLFIIFLASSVAKIIYLV